MKNKINPLLIIAIFVVILDIFLFVFSTIIKNYDSMFIYMVIIALIMLLIVNIRSGSLYKKSYKNSSNKDEIEKKQKNQKYYWLLFLSQISLVIIVYLILHFGFNY